MTIPELETERLCLHAWRESDRDAFVVILADPDGVAPVLDAAPPPGFFAP